jgi:ribonuclease Z|tara:strand:+ start:3292 stop:4317 length:1026 start_codon:yes stop_codon:yes gene_type:complete
MKNNARKLASSVLILALMSIVSPFTAHAQSFDGLKVFFCGTGGPLASSGRAQPCTAIQAGDSLYLIDNGVGGWNTLRGMRAPVTSLKAIFITHLHSDHIAGVGEAAEQSWINGRVEPLTVIGPDGVDNLADGFNLVYERDRVFRKAHHEQEDNKFPLDAAEIRSKVVEIPDPAGTALALKVGELSITAIRVAHDPVSPAFGYRFDYKGRSVVISGDTIAWPPLGAAANGADVLIHEAQSNAMQISASRRASRINPRGAAMLADTVTYHTEPREAAELAQSAGVGMLVLSHLTQAGMPEFLETFTEGIEEGIEESGNLNWHLAEDGMTLELPAGGTEINIAN